MSEYARRNPDIGTSDAEPENQSGVQYCDHPDCNEIGLHRAPRSRENLRDYYWFCLSHVREYNAAWNFCEGMSVDQVDAAIRDDVVWGRPTWPLGMIRTLHTDATFDDPFGAFEEAARRSAKQGSGTKQGKAAPKGSELYYIRLLQRKTPVTLTALKARYKELAKRLHPDVNGGDKDAEERLKEINEAYTALKKIAV